MNIVKELRKKKGIQQKELALEIGVAQPTVSEWELNKKDPSGDRLKKLSEFFGVDELVILGKGVVDLTGAGSEPASTSDQILRRLSALTPRQEDVTLQFLSLTQDEMLSVMDYIEFLKTRKGRLST